MVEIITLRMMLEARFPKGSRMQSKQSKIEDAQRNNRREKKNY